MKTTPRIPWVSPRKLISNTICHGETPRNTKFLPWFFEASDHVSTTCLCAAAKNAQHWRLATQLSDGLAPTNSAATAARRAGRWEWTWICWNMLKYDILDPYVVWNQPLGSRSCWDTCDAHSSACCDCRQMLIVAADLITTRVSDVQSYHLPECILRLMDDMDLHPASASCLSWEPQYP